MLRYFRCPTTETAGLRILTVNEQFQFQGTGGTGSWFPLGKRRAGERAAEHLQDLINSGHWIELYTAVEVDEGL